MVIRSEVIATIPFSKKRGIPYVCYTTTDGGKVVVAENGVPKFKTGVQAEPGSNYVIEGKDVVRYWDPDEESDRRQAAAALRAREEVVRSQEFALVAAMVAKRTAGKATLESWQGLDEDVPLWVIRDIKEPRDLEDLRKGLEASLATVVFCEENALGKTVTALAVLPGLDPIDACDWLSPHVPVADLRLFLRQLDDDCGVNLELVGRDCVRFSLRGKPKKPAQHVKVLLEIELDEAISKSEATAMIREGTFFFWWD